MIEQKPHEIAAARIAQAAAAKAANIDPKSGMQAAERDLLAQLQALKQANDLEEQRLRIENLRQANSDIYLNSIHTAYNTVLGMFSEMQALTRTTEELSDIQLDQLNKLGQLHAVLVDRLHAFWIREQPQKSVDNVSVDEGAE